MGERKWLLLTSRYEKNAVVPGGELSDAMSEGEHGLCLCLPPAPPQRGRQLAVDGAGDGIGPQACFVKTRTDFVQRPAALTLTLKIKIIMQIMQK